MSERRILRLDPRILCGDIDVTATTSFTDRSWRDQYEIWRHGNGLLDASEPSRQDCAAALFQLNRAVDFRDIHLSKLYRFGAIPGMARLKQHEVMQQLGLIMPIMKTKLDHLRNRLMHSPGEKPPAPSVCREMAEFAWYYLRSTDRLCDEFASNIDVTYLQTEQGKKWISVEVEPRTWTVSVSGWVPGRFVVPEEVQDGIVLDASNLLDDARRSDELGLFSAAVVGPSESIRRLIERHFAATVGTIG